MSPKTQTCTPVKSTVAAVASKTCSSFQSINRSCTHPKIICTYTATTSMSQERASCRGVQLLELAMGHRACRGS
jgi:hypothetical protein